MKKFNLSFQKLFENDLFLKIFSIVAAIIAWFAVVSSQMDDINQTIHNVPVQINYEGSIPQSLGLQPIGNTEIMVSVNVTGKNTKVRRLKPEDFSASISLNSVNQAQSYTLPIDVTKKSTDSDYQITGYSETTATLIFDKIVSKPFPVQVTAPGLSAADGYIMQKFHTDVENIMITGPENEISQIEHCVINIDKENENLTKNLVFTGTPALIDKKGFVLNSENIIVEPSVVEVTVPIYKTKQMQMKPSFINVPKGFPLNDFHYTLSQKKIMVAASGDIIDNQDEISLSPPIDFRTIEAGKVYNLEVTLPAGYVNQENITTVSLTIPKYGITSKTYSVPRSNFVIENVPADFDAAIVPQNLSNVKICGEVGAIMDLTADDLIVSVDLSDTTAIKGQYTVTARVYCQDSILAWAVGEYSTTVELTAKK